MPTEKFQTIVESFNRIQEEVDAIQKQVTSDWDNGELRTAGMRFFSEAAIFVFQVNSAIDKFMPQVIEVEGTWQMEDISKLAGLGYSMKEDR